MAAISLLLAGALLKRTVVRALVCMRSKGDARMEERGGGWPQHFIIKGEVRATSGRFDRRTRADKATGW